MKNLFLFIAIILLPTLGISQFKIGPSVALSSQPYFWENETFLTEFKGVINLTYGLSFSQSLSNKFNIQFDFGYGSLDFRTVDRFEKLLLQEGDDPLLSGKTKNQFSQSSVHINPTLYLSLISNNWYGLSTGLGFSTNILTEQSYSEDEIPFYENMYYKKYVFGQLLSIKNQFGLNDQIDIFLSTNFGWYYGPVHKVSYENQDSDRKIKPQHVAVNLGFFYTFSHPN